MTLTDQIAAVLKDAGVVPTRDIPDIATAITALPLIREAEAMRDQLRACLKELGDVDATFAYRGSPADQRLLDTISDTEDVLARVAAS